MGELKGALLFTTPAVDENEKGKVRIRVLKTKKPKNGGLGPKESPTGRVFRG